MSNRNFPISIISSVLISGCVNQFELVEYSSGENYSIPEGYVFTEVIKETPEVIEEHINRIRLGGSDYSRNEFDIDDVNDFIVKKTVVPNVDEVNGKDVIQSIDESKLFIVLGDGEIAKLYYSRPQTFHTSTPQNNCLKRFERVHTWRYPVAGQYSQQIWCQYPKYDGSEKEFRRLRRDWYYFGEEKHWYRLGKRQTRCFRRSGEKNFNIPKNVFRHLCGTIARPTK